MPAIYIYMPSGDVRGYCNDHIKVGCSCTLPLEGEPDILYVDGRGREGDVCCEYMMEVPSAASLIRDCLPGLVQVPRVVAYQFALDRQDDPAVLEHFRLQYPEDEAIPVIVETFLNRSQIDYYVSLILKEVKKAAPGAYVQIDKHAAEAMLEWADLYKTEIDAVLERHRPM